MICHRTEIRCCSIYWSHKVSVTVYFTSMDICQGLINPLVTLTDVTYICLHWSILHTYVLWYAGRLVIVPSLNNFMLSPVCYFTLFTSFQVIEMKFVGPAETSSWKCLTWWNEFRFRLDWSWSYPIASKHHKLPSKVHESTSNFVHWPTSIVSTTWFRVSK